MIVTRPDGHGTVWVEPAPEPCPGTGEEHAPSLKWCDWCGAVGYSHAGPEPGSWCEMTHTSPEAVEACFLSIGWVEFPRSSWLHATILVTTEEAEQMRRARYLQMVTP